MSKIIIQRETARVDRFRNYKVILNDKDVGRIGQGESKEFDSPAGDNELFLKIGWCRSNKLQFKANKDGVVNFECGSNMKGIKKWLFSYIYVISMRHEYIWLKKVSD